MHSAGNHARISPGPGDSRAQQVLAARRGSSHLEAPEATKSQSSSDPGRLQGLGGRTQVLLSEPHPEAAPMWPGPRRWDIQVPSRLFPAPAPFAGRVSRGLTFRLSQRTWFQVQEAQGDWSPGDRDISASPGPGPQSPWGFRSGSGSVLPRRARCRAVCGAVPGWPTTVFLFLLIPPHPRVGH